VACLKFEAKRFIVKRKERRFVEVEETAPLPPAKKRGWLPFAREKLLRA
jgi:hypothetical protein